MSAADFRRVLERGGFTGPELEDVLVMALLVADPAPPVSEDGPLADAVASFVARTGVDLAAETAGATLTAYFDDHPLNADLALALAKALRADGGAEALSLAAEATKTLGGNSATKDFVRAQQTKPSEGAESPLSLLLNRRG